MRRTTKITSTTARQARIRIPNIMRRVGAIQKGLGSSSTLPVTVVSRDAAGKTTGRVAKLRSGTAPGALSRTVTAKGARRYSAQATPGTSRQRYSRLRRPSGSVTGSRGKPSATVKPWKRSRRSGKSTCCVAGAVTVSTTLRSCSRRTSAGSARSRISTEPHERFSRSTAGDVSPPLSDSTPPTSASRSPRRHRAGHGLARREALNPRFIGGASRRDARGD